MSNGLLPPSAVTRGRFRAIYRGIGNRGISHCDQVDMRRRPLSRKAGDGILDIVDLYRQIAAELRDQVF